MKGVMEKGYGEVGLVLMKGCSIYSGVMGILGFLW